MGQIRPATPSTASSRNLALKAEILAEIRRPARAERGLEGKRQPAAAILTCVDERVLPETVFQCGPGRLYCVRLAGHVVTPEVVCSLEIAIALGCRLVFVLGHTDCGAVRIERAHTGEHFAVAQHIRWATRALAWGATLNQAIEENVRHGVTELRSRLRIRVEGGVLNLSNGEWNILEVAGVAHRTGTEASMSVDPVKPDN
jgi:carbonic anhydrase